jgi:hypothetical protein
MTMRRYIKSFLRPSALSRGHAISYRNSCPLLSSQIHADTAMRVQRVPSQLATSALSSRSPFPSFFLPSAFLLPSFCLFPSLRRRVQCACVGKHSLGVCWIFFLNPCRGWGFTRPWRLVRVSPMKAGLVWSPEPQVIAVCFRVILTRVLVGNTYAPDMFSC